MMDLHLAELPKGPDRPQSTPKNNSYVLKHFKMLSKVKQFFFYNNLCTDFYDNGVY